MSTRMFKTGDKILIVSIAAIAVLFMAWNTFVVSHDQQITAVITQNGNVIKQINLNDLKNPESIYINEPIKQVIIAEKGRIRFLESDCPNQICVKTGWLTKSGDRAVCLPSKVVITIVGGNKEVDSVSY
ncbi:MAG TPA: NusG domain II-containing protein [Syntrophomonadaceae bacterium]|nr:NusG domain II-containing protein [Syntrophomonadaceae bacterium]